MFPSCWLSRSSGTAEKEEEEWWNRELVRKTEGVAREGLRALRAQIDEGAPASQTIGTIVDDVVVEGQELLTTEVSRGLVVCRCVDGNSMLPVARSMPILPPATSALFFAPPKERLKRLCRWNNNISVDGSRPVTSFAGGSRLAGQAENQKPGLLKHILREANN